MGRRTFKPAIGLGLWRTATAACRVFRQFDAPHGWRHAVKDVQLAFLVLTKAREDTDRFHRSEAADKAAHRPQYALRGAVVAIVGVMGITDEAAVTGRVVLPSCEGANLAMKLPNGGADEGGLCRQAKVVDDQAGGKIVAAVDDDIDAVQNVRCGGMINATSDRMKCHIRV